MRGRFTCYTEMISEFNSGIPGACSIAQTLYLLIPSHRNMNFAEAKDLQLLFILPMLFLY
jgi:hypothetical protein